MWFSVRRLRWSVLRFSFLTVFSRYHADTRSPQHSVKAGSENQREKQDKPITHNYRRKLERHNKK